MDANPYSRILRAVQQHPEQGAAPTGPVKLRLGTVIGKSPLRLSVGGVTQPTHALRINERLTQGARWSAQITGTAYNDPSISRAEIKQLSVDLDVGDEVLLLTEDDQIYYILMKVVKAQ